MQNVIALTGRLTTDPDLRTVTVGEEQRAVTTLRVAVDRGYRGKGADFFDVTVWGKQGQACAEHLVRGQQIAVTGSLRSREWDTEQGKRYRVDILASSVDFGPKPNGQASSQPEAEPEAGSEDLAF